MRSIFLPSMPVIKSVTDMRYQSREIVDTLVKEEKAIYLTKDNDPVGVMLPIKTYKKLSEFIEELEDALDAATLDKAIEESAGDFVDLEEFDKEQLKKRGRSHVQTQTRRSTKKISR